MSLTERHRGIVKPKIDTQLKYKFHWKKGGIKSNENYIKMGFYKNGIKES